MVWAVVVGIAPFAYLGVMVAMCLAVAIQILHAEEIVTMQFIVLVSVVYIMVKNIV